MRPTLNEKIVDMQNWINNLNSIELFFTAFTVLSTIILGLRNFLGFLSQRYGFGIAGDWNIRIESSTHPGPHGRMKLKQIGPFVWGSGEISVTQSGRANRILSYTYTGRFSKEQAVLCFRETGKDARLIGATVLKLSTRGDGASGCNAFWDHTINARRYQEFALERINGV